MHSQPRAENEKFNKKFTGDGEMEGWFDSV